MRLLLISLFLSLSLFAEATFDQVQTMIERHDYKQAKLALHVIIANHPTSAKAHYTLAQATAGLGDLPSAREALDRATALDPHLSFAPPSAVTALRDALTPPTAKIIPIQQSSHTFLYVVLATLGFTGLYYYYFRRPKSAPVTKPTPSSKYEPSRSSTSTSYRSTARYTPPTRDLYSTYSNSTPSRPTEVHHHHDSPSSSGMSTLGTVAIAAGTAAVVSSMMDSHSSPIITPTYEEPSYSSVSSSWEDTTSTSSSWEEPTTRSSSWDSSSSSSDSWSSSSDSSSSSSWD